MKIAGIQKLTLLDYPEKLAATIFLAGCNLKCTFCQNVDLIYKPNEIKPIDKNEIFDFLKERYGKLEGVCITGGEPLINDDIIDFIKEIKKIGYLIKLDTNGYFPDTLKNILDMKIVNMVAMDIKSGNTKYETITGSNSKEYLKSIKILMNSDIDFEFRTTCVKGIHDDNDFYEISDMIKGNEKYYLQDYRSNELIDHLPYSAFNIEELEHFKSIVIKNIPNTIIRGV